MKAIPSKLFSKTFVAKSYVLALASLAIAINSASANLTYDLRAVSATGGATVVNAGTAALGNQTSAVTNAVAGTVVTMQVWAQVSATTVGNGVFGYSSAVGGITSAANGVAPFLVGAMSNTNLVQSPFTFAFSDGTAVLNGTTGSTDINGTGTSNNTSYIQALNNTTSSTNSTAVNGTDYVTSGTTGTNFNNIGNGTTFFGSEFLLGIATYTVSSAPTGSSIALNWAIPTLSGASSKAARGGWTQGDAGNDTGNLQAASMFSGSALTITAAVPEPGTYAMLLGGFGILVGIQRFRRCMV